MQENAKVRKSTHKYAKVCKSMQKYAKVRKSSGKYAFYVVLRKHANY